MSDPAMVTSSPVFGRRDPDARGYFGAYGGRYVPETLVAPVEELEAAYRDARQDAAYREELSRLLDRLCRTPDTDDEGEAADGGGGRSIDLVEPGGLGAHGRAQDQQRLGPGATGVSDGEASGGGRNRGGAARCRNRHGVRAARPGVRRVHGRRRHGAPGAERGSDADPWARRCAKWTPAGPR